MDPKDCTIADIYSDAEAQETRVKLSDDSVYRFGGIEASSELGGCSRVLLTPVGDGTTDIVGPVIDEHSCDLLEKLGADVSGVRVPEKTIAVKPDATEVPEVIAKGADAPAPPSAVATIDVTALSPAQPAPMTQRSAPDTHVVVHADSVSAIARLLHEAEHGVAGAFDAVKRAFGHVFHHEAAP